MNDRPQWQSAARTGLRHSVIVLGVIVDLVVWNGAYQTRSGGALPFWLPPTMMALCALPLFWRFRAPVLCTIPAWLLGGAALAVPQWQPFTGILIAVHAVAATRPGRISIPIAWTCAIPFGIDAVDSAERTSGPSAGVFAGFLVFWGIVTVAAWGFGRWTYRAEQRTVAALRANRLQLAHDLHDKIANNLTAMMLYAEQASSVIEADHPASRPLATVDLAGNRAMQEMARLLHVLRTVDTGSSEASPEPHAAGIDALGTLLDDIERIHGLKVSAAVGGEERPLAQPQEHVLYRVAQEALINAAKHGDPTTRATLQLKYEPSRVVMEISNHLKLEPSPATIPAPRRSFGWGLTGLREQVELIGGTLKVERIQGAFVVHAAVPTSPMRTDNRWAADV